MYAHNHTRIQAHWHKKKVSHITAKHLQVMKKKILSIILCFVVVVLAVSLTGSSFRSPAQSAPVHL